MKINKYYFILQINILFYSTCLAQNSVADYSPLHIAKQQCKNRNYLYCYKNLIIFKYKNIEFLYKDVNIIALNQIDSDISRLENFLQQRNYYINNSISRGLTESDSSFLKKNENFECKYQTLLK